MNLCIGLQPIVYGITKDRLAHEVLARWQLKSTGEIITPAERKNAINWAQVDRDVLALISFHAPRLAQLTPRLFINLSAQTVGDVDSWSLWLTQLQQLVSQARFAITIEISEDMSDEAVRAIWQPLRRLRVKLAMDDFGRGYSTRARLTQYDWDYCKFEASTLYDADTICGLQFCQHGNIMPIIERVEHAISQKQFMVMGLHWQQGFYHGRPELLSQLLKRNERNTPLSL